jgi:hypothetical protein
MVYEIVFGDLGNMQHWNYFSWASLCPVTWYLTFYYFLFHGDVCNQIRNRQQLANQDRVWTITNQCVYIYFIINEMFQGYFIRDLWITFFQLQTVETVVPSQFNSEPVGVSLAFGTLTKPPLKPQIPGRSPRKRGKTPTKARGDSDSQPSSCQARLRECRC